MASLEENLQELEYVKQAFKDDFDNKGVSSAGVEFRNMHLLIAQMEKILPRQTKEVTPTTSAQHVSADEGFKLTGVNVNPVTSAIDENIQPENIKSGTTILGVTGTLEEGGGELAGYNVESIVSEDGASQTLKITSGFSANGNPIEIATDEEMTNALTQANLGKVYKFTGTSSTYETDAIYIVSEVE
jgi:hypothetical protein